jgi:uncharacterized protein YbjQ (UPF0145 family)
MVVTTTPSIEGTRVVKYLGLVSGDAFWAPISFGISLRRFVIS